jgi:tetratricopeptide (TPR) repeat protein
MPTTQPNAAAADPALQQQLAQGFALLRQGRAEQAIELSDRLLAEHPGHAEALFLASESRLAAGDAGSAIGYICAAVDAAPGQWPLLLKQAENLFMLRRRSEARQAAARAVEAAGDDGPALWELARFYNRCDDPLRAQPLYERALAAVGSHPDLLYDLATVRFFAGDVAGAEAALEALLRQAPAHGHALYLRATLRRQTESSHHVDDLQARLAAGFPSAAARAACLFALAKDLEDLGRDDASFAALTEGAVLKRQTLTYDAAAERASIEAIRATYTTQVMAAETAGHDEQGAIFIVGMPRSGTTLLERMLGRHTDVKSAGELLDFGQVLAAAARQSMAACPGRSMVEASLEIDFAALGHDYMAGARQAADGSPVFIDKLPVNYLYCGLIRKALPNARILHLVRDPMDSCYAVYKTLFSQAYFFSYEFDELAAYYAGYHRLMRHWHAVMPGSVLDVHYEDLVTDTQAQARRVLAWCGLDWQDDVLRPSENTAPATTASAAQVREPVYDSSLHKWRRFEAGLAPLKARLFESGILDA